MQGTKIEKTNPTRPPAGPTHANGNANPPSNRQRSKRIRYVTMGNSSSNRNNKPPLRRFSLLALLIIISVTVTQAEAFSGSIPRSIAHTKHNNKASGISMFRRSKAPATPSKPTSTVLSSTKGGSQAAASTPMKKPRISAFDSLRFFLIAQIVVAHFVAFAGPSELAQRFILQHNVAVGAFFAISGYVTAYTSTELNKYEASPKLSPSPNWILSRIFGYYPLHLLVLALFSPMFLFADVSYNGWTVALWHGFLSVTLTQAWFPMHAEVWNAPTWFLSALNFATAVMPFSLPSISKLTKKQLRKMAGVLFIIGLLPKIGYCYDHNAWALMEGTMAPKAMANLAIFNTQRFTPFHATIEVLLGAVACRLVMLDGVEGETKTNSLSTALPLLAMLGITALRAFEIIGLSDLLTRAIFFIPLFLNFLMAIHRSTVQDSKDALVKILNSKFLVGLGGLSFPMFIMHGPIGQLFYKKIIAKKLFGGPMHIVKGTWFFYVYLGCVLASAFVLKNTFLSSKTVGKWSKDSVAKISSWF